jgi:hypothetical protein
MVQQRGRSSPFGRRKPSLSKLFRAITSDRWPCKGVVGRRSGGPLAFVPPPRPRRRRAPAIATASAAAWYELHPSASRCSSPGADRRQRQRRRRRRAARSRRAAEAGAHSSIRGCSWRSRCRCRTAGPTDSEVAVEVGRPARPPIRDPTDSPHRRRIGTRLPMPTRSEQPASVRQSITILRERPRRGSFWVQHARSAPMTRPHPVRQ